MSAKPTIFFIDNFDSFSFNLVDEFRKRGCAVDVWRNDLSPERVTELALALPPPALVVMSPGPGTPAEAGCCLELVRNLAGKIPIFGVCLGHQVIVEALGGTVSYAGEVVHGKSALIHHDGQGIFAGLDSPMGAARYHSLAAVTLPDSLRVMARTGTVVMAVLHEQHPIIGLQFHPESILTPQGGILIEKIINWACERDTRSR